MGKFKIVRVSEASFLGDDDNEVHGKYIYVVPVDGAGSSRRIFLTSDRLLNMEYVPKAFDEVYVFENSMGRVVDIIKV